ncbi:hypothetical protein BX070DRAFT_251671 [Coemansia spiralis]|nr:hypothetical protein BX070DRAFT_251671 [Coemansia spiralis]
MNSPTLRDQAALLCVAINAAPLLADILLVALSNTPSQDKRKDLFDILELHGGERFGERDNTNELSIIETWLKDEIDAKAGDKDVVPTIHGLIDTICLKQNVNTSFIRHMGNGGYYLNAEQFDADLKRCWARSSAEVSSIPPLLLTSQKMSVSALCSTTMLDFYSCTSTKTRKSRQAEIENAQRQCDSSKAILSSIGVPGKASSCTEIINSLRAIREWISSPAAILIAESTQIPILQNNPSACITSIHQSIWESLAERADRYESCAQRRRVNAERTERYVLRAFVVDNGISSDAKRRISVVRRFGRVNGLSHYSLLDSDGVCWPTRIQDIKGTVVESMWVCCSDDSESKGWLPDTDLANVSSDTNTQSGLNTVVADPDDEIFCRICSGFESWSYNQIIICDGCEQGVHQMCHDPIVTEDDLTLDQWYCSNCSLAYKNASSTKRPRTS